MIYVRLLFIVKPLRNSIYLLYLENTCLRISGKTVLTNNSIETFGIPIYNAPATCRKVAFLGTMGTISQGYDFDTAENDSQFRLHSGYWKVAYRSYYTGRLPVYTTPRRFPFSGVLRGASNLVDRPSSPWSSWPSHSNASPASTSLPDMTRISPPQNYPLPSCKDQSFVILAPQPTPFYKRATYIPNAYPIMSLDNSSLGFPSTLPLLPGATYSTSNEVSPYITSRCIFDRPKRLHPTEIEPMSSINTLSSDNSPQSEWRNTSSTSALENALGSFKFGFGKQVNDGTPVNLGIQAVTDCLQQRTNQCFSSQARQPG